jgi:hypothetical protein
MNTNGKHLLKNVFVPSLSWKEKQSSLDIERKTKKRAIARDRVSKPLPPPSPIASSPVTSGAPFRTRISCSPNKKPNAADSRCPF